MKTSFLLVSLLTDLQRLGVLEGARAFREVTAHVISGSCSGRHVTALLLRLRIALVRGQVALQVVEVDKLARALITWACVLASRPLLLVNLQRDAASLGPFFFNCT